MNDEGYQQQLEQLKVEHRDLDDAIRALSSQTIVDQLQIAHHASGRPACAGYHCLIGLFAILTILHLSIRRFIPVQSRR